MSKRKWIVGLIAVEEDELAADGFPRGEELGCVPDALNDAIERLAPGGSLDLNMVYLLSDEQKVRLLKYLNRNAIDYHEYVVSERGETCRKEGCTDHHKAVVIQLHDRRKRDSKSG